MIFKLASGGCFVVESATWWEWSTASRFGPGPKDHLRIWFGGAERPAVLGPTENATEAERLLLKVHGNPQEKPARTTLPSMGRAERVVAEWVVTDKIMMKADATRHLEWRIHRAIEDALDEQAGVPPLTQ